jgi:lactoylglutathione lyase
VIRRFPITDWFEGRRRELLGDRDYPCPRRVGAVVPAALQESRMKVGFVVLYVNDPVACRRFWVEQVGMVEKQRQEAGAFTIALVGFPDQSFGFQLVPLEMMKDNPDGLDLATPSICFNVDDLEAARATLVERGVQATEVGEHHGTRSFAFPDPEGHWFAVTPA